MELGMQILVGLVVALAAGAIFYLLQLRRLGSAASERLSRAHKELVDTIEIDVVNGQKISRNVLSRLIKAASREHNVDLERVCSPMSLAEDVELRLETNRYLDSNKKQDYIKQVRAAIRNMQAPEAPTPVLQPGELRRLRAAISADDKERALQIIESLSRLSYRREEELSQLTERSEARRALLTSLTIGIVTAMLGFLVAYLTSSF